MTPGSAFRLELFASLVCCFLSARMSYVASPGFSLETVVALLPEGYTVKLRNVERPNKKKGKCTNATNRREVVWARQPHSVVNDAFFSRQAPFFLVQDMPALNKL